MPRKRSWTDDDLRRAVAEGDSWRQVIHGLRLTVGGWTYLAVRERAKTLGLDTSHLVRGARRDPTARVTDDEIRAAHRGARTMPELIRFLDLDAGSGTYPILRERMVRLGLSAPGPGGGSAGAASMHDTPGGWTDDDLRAALVGARSMAEVIRRLGLRPTSAARVYVGRRIEEIGLSTDHLLGQASNRGRSRPGRYQIPLEEVLVENSEHLCTSSLRQRLVDQGVKDRRCEMCDRTDWNGQPIPLQLDHINGDRRDNRLENLRLICPNCHSQTDTWCGKNIGRYEDDG